MRIRTGLAAFGYGVVSGFIVLLPTYTPLAEHYPDWVPLLAWSSGPFLAAATLAMRHPDVGWKLAMWIEVGVVVGVVVDIRLRGYLDMPSTVWPIAIALAVAVSVPFVVVGTVLGRERARIKHQTP